MRSRSFLAFTVLVTMSTTGAADEVLDHARQAACDLGGPADFISIVQHGDGLTEQEISATVAEQSAGWPEKLAGYARSPGAGLLVDYARAAAQFRKSDGRYSAEACRILKPLYKVVDDARRLASYGIGPGAALLVEEDSKEGVPLYLDQIGERCDYLPYDIPAQQPCE